MPVLLRRSGEMPDAQAYDAWLAVSGARVPPALDGARKLPKLAARLEAAFVAERDAWLGLGHALAGEPTADMAQMPTAAAFGSDFGVMLAWARLVDELTQGNSRILVLCDDPWLYRHLAGRNGVRAGTPPALFPRTFWLAVRGALARARLALHLAWAALRLRRFRRATLPGEAVILVYGHPASDAKGNDAYFGDLMARFPSLKRFLHTDCGVGRAARLCADGRTASLHAWGSVAFAVTLVAERWRPGQPHLAGPHGWLVRRAAAFENGGGGPAINRWQAHCQERWLVRARPDRVLWPWENHGWERNLCRAGRAHGIALIGYQHTVIGPHQFNYSTATNPDGLMSIPDVVVADGPAYAAEMKALGVPAERLVVGGAFRFKRFKDGLYDPAGPVFVPLSPVGAAARAQLAVARDIAGRGRRVLVKQHPMYPAAFAERINLSESARPLAEQKAISAVLYATGTSGLEARLMGVPAYQLMLEDRIAIDVLPAFIDAERVTAEDAADAVLAGRARPGAVEWDDVLSDPNYALWENLLFGEVATVLASPGLTKKAS